ncbi:hypothetical protein SAMN03159341_11932 [Paenibacillus sp. 1_12]|uniref:hypothetical protein n=1 Tax=Paenibacillus sp. 1_12 TaxID=1566278 RepID=UPI0008F44E7C|nr:hypothetical protein [Paenibacillus sp. 1_12]SFM17341.1 hypothetical protein SAMN03159341_11932 [Paenibacillus sp. 1_12]
MSRIDIGKIIAESVFCYARSEGQGLVNKVQCACYQQGQKKCEAYLQMENFHKRYKELQIQGLPRKETLQIIEKELEGEEHHWYRQNVKP